MSPLIYFKNAIKCYMGCEGNTKLNKNSRSSPYHGEGHPVYFVLIFGFVLSERAVAAGIKDTVIMWCQPTQHMPLTAIR